MKGQVQPFSPWMNAGVSMKTEARRIPCCPFMVKGDFVYDAGGMRLLVCSPARDCSQIFRERDVDADPHFICPECGRLGQRMAELRPDQERYFTPEGTFIPPNVSRQESTAGEEQP